jgi:hypothetical protein
MHVILTLSLSKGKNPRISLLLLLVLTLYPYPQIALNPSRPTIPQKTSFRPKLLTVSL